MIRIRCEICETVIASCDPAKLRAPLDSTMFGPPEEGFDSPWLEPVEWLHLYCPVCRKRFCIEDNRVWTEDREYITVPLKDPQPEIDAMGAVLQGEDGPESIEDAVRRLAKEPLTPTEIGNRLGVTRQKVTAILRK